MSVRTSTSSGFLARAAVVPFLGLVIMLSVKISIAEMYQDLAVLGFELICRL
jgi:hypothetical protein